MCFLKIAYLVPIEIETLISQIEAFGLRQAEQCVSANAYI